MPSLTPDALPPDTFRLTGRLCFRQAGPLRPLAHVQVEVWDDNRIFSDKRLAATHSDQDGRFSVDLPAATRRERLLVKVVDTYRRWDQGGAPTDEVRPVWAFHPEISARPPLPAPDLLDLQTLSVPWWSYRPDFPTPRGQDPRPRSPEQGEAPAGLHGGLPEDAAVWDAEDRSHGGEVEGGEPDL